MGGEVPLLEMRGISKHFDEVRALEDVNFTVHHGEVHALVGENGAGKSTLIKVLSGYHQRDGGTILLEGRELSPRSPLDSQAAGISVIYQDFDLAPNLSVADNLLLGREPTRFAFLRPAELARRAQGYLEAAGVRIDVHTPVSRLSIAQRQLVAIARALSWSARILVMDEPTSALTADDIVNLHSLIERLAREGTSVVYISHKMEEVFQVSDVITVLRDGRWVGTRRREETSREEIVSLMVGRTREGFFTKRDRVREGVLLEARDLGRKGSFSGVSLRLHEGEILGIYGLKGSGRSEIANALFGLAPADAGEIRVRGRPVALASPGAAIRSGIGMIPEDRAVLGLFPNMNIRENVSLAYLDRCSRMGFLKRAAERERVSLYAERLRIKMRGIEQSIGTLSGGNQQKAVLARWLAMDPGILLLDEPTVGIDVGAKAEIYRLMDELAAAGMGLLLISSELPEIIGMSDRILVLHGGRIVAEFPRGQATEDRIIHSIHQSRDRTE